MATLGDDNSEDDGSTPDRTNYEDITRRIDDLLPLLTFVVDRADNTTLTTFLVVVLALRAAAALLDRDGD